MSSKSSKDHEKGKMKTKANTASTSAPIDIPGSKEKSMKASSNDEEEDDTVPPHEYIARKLARSHISSSSVTEGKGRTLKGRDLTKFRNDVWKKTGFIE
ncbi:protein S40-7-like [Lotus japonicus]|uniref:protein S40-7-like n=1 Tax=Lotus japonicus TaxID=34305 RepID=UPI00258B17C6|nr:protein S40-7-like [Lotus japonicus]